MGSPTISEQDLEQALKALVEVSKVEAFVSRSATPPADADLPQVNLLFARFREDSPDIEALAEFLSMQVVNYVIPLKKRKEAVVAASKAAGGADASIFDRLVREARRMLIELNLNSPSRASEVGELLAYLVAQQWLGAFQLASKMAIKTSANMPIHGLDGIHARLEGGIMTLFFMESKLAGSAKNGMREFSKSISAFALNRKQYLLEYTIISDLSNLDSLKKAARLAALDYLDVYGPKKSHRIERPVGVICYSEPLFNTKMAKSPTTTPQAHEDEFATRYRAEHAMHRLAFKKVLSAKKLGDGDASVWLMAVPDKDELRTLFYKSLAK